MCNPLRKIVFDIFECTIRRDCHSATIDERNIVDVVDRFESKAIFSATVPSIAVSGALHTTPYDPSPSLT
jgi:hypothetical protein